jgi:hypothetical protein
VEQELLTIPEHLSSPPVFSGVRVIRSLLNLKYRFKYFKIVAIMNWLPYAGFQYLKCTDK